MRLKGIHDIKTVHSLGISIRRINVNIESPADGGIGRGKAFRPHVWTFTTRPGFTRVSPTRSAPGQVGVEKVEELSTEVFPTPECLRDSGRVKESDELTVIARLPGVKEEDIKIDVDGDILNVLAEAGKEKMYTKELLLPWIVDSKNIEWSYKDEILELKLRKAT